MWKWAWLIGAYSCGTCRQAIAGQSGNGAKVYVYASAAEVTEHAISELLPNSFFGNQL